MNIQPLDVVVLVHDVPTHHLRRGDVGAVVEVYGSELSQTVLNLSYGGVANVLASKFSR